MIKVIYYYWSQWYDYNIFSISLWDKLLSEILNYLIHLFLLSFKVNVFFVILFQKNSSFFFNSIFSCFFSFQITNIHFYFLLFHVFQILYSWKRENLFLSCNEKNVLPIFENSKKNFWKTKTVHLFKLIFIKMKIFTVFLEYSIIFYFFQNFLRRSFFYVLFMRNYFF